MIYIIDHIIVKQGNGLKLVYVIMFDRCFGVYEFADCLICNSTNNRISEGGTIITIYKMEWIASKALIILIYIV